MILPLMSLRVRRNSRAASTPPANRECQVWNSVRPRRAASSASNAICRVVAAGGFSSITCLPARNAVSAASKCACGGVQMEMQ